MPFTFLPGNDLISAINHPLSTINYVYDLNGNLITKTQGANTTTYTWDYDNRLLAINHPLYTIDHVYDGNGNRISKTVDGVKTNYINDVGLGLVQVLMETNEAGEAQASYTYGNDLISINNEQLAINNYYHYDGLGSVRQLTDDTEAVVAEYTYDAFGNVIASTGTGENTYGFTGEQQFNEADNLVFLRARYYDSSIGRFISRDPILSPMQIGDNFVWLLPYLISQPQYLQHYQYVNNNPLNYTDPSGYENWWDRFIEWLRSWIGYILPSPIGEAAGVCEAAPNILKIMKEKERLNNLADELGVDRPYPYNPYKKEEN